MGCLHEFCRNHEGEEAGRGDEEGRREGRGEEGEGLQHDVEDVGDRGEDVGDRGEGLQHDHDNSCWRDATKLF